jgi:hypothetical protein
LLVTLNLALSPTPCQQLDVLAGVLNRALAFYDAFISTGSDPHRDGGRRRAATALTVQALIPKSA